MRRDQIIERAAGLLEASVDGETVGLDVDSGTCFGFNATASRIWALLDEPRSLGSLVDRLVAEYEIGRDECEREVVALLRDLEGDGLVRLSPAG